jgi:hypothetical protein
MDKGMAGNLIPEPSRSAGERIKLRSASHRIGCSAVLGAIVLARLCRAQALAGRWPASVAPVR